MGDTPEGSLGICPKCRERPAEFTVRKNYTSCFPCLEALLSLKIKTILKGKGGVAYKEHIAVAFSGGSSSSLMLEFMTKFRDMQAGPYDKQKMAFDLSVFHIAVDSESAINGVEEQVEATARQIIKENPDITFKSVPLSDLYSEETPDPSLRQAMLTELLASVKDSTGRADLISYLKITLLLQLCKEAGCKKLIIGYNAAAFAIRAIASAVKGAGYALPSDAQHVDSRYALTGGATIIYPMKDLTDEEIDVVCRVLGLPCKQANETTTTTSNGDGQVAAPLNNEIDKHNINALAGLFIQNVLKHNPGAVHNINSTISKLEAFSWNGIDSSSTSRQLDVRPGEKERNFINGADDSEIILVDEVFCPLCCAPLADDEVCNAVTAHTGSLSGVCDSCRHQIFGAITAGGAPAESENTVLEKLPRCVVKNIEKTAIKWNKVSLNLTGEELSANELRKLIAFG